MNKLGISSIKELTNADPLLLKQKLGTIGLQHFFHANGIDESNVREKYIPKSSSFSNSQILPRDYHKQKEIELVIKEMAENLAIRLRKGGRMASNLSLYVVLQQALNTLLLRFHAILKQHKIQRNCKTSQFFYFVKNIKVEQ